MADTYGPRLIGTIGFALLVPASICLRFVSSATTASKVTLCALLAIIGVGLDVTDPAGYILVDDVLTGTLRTMSQTEGWKDMASRAFGLQHSAQYVGVTVGPFLVLVLPAEERLAYMGILLGCFSAVTAAIWVFGARLRNEDGEREEVIGLR